MLRELIYTSLLIVAFVVLAFAALLKLPKENWNTEDKWARRCDAGDTFNMSRKEAAACTARLLARGSK